MSLYYAIVSLRKQADLLPLIKLKITLKINPVEYKYLIKDLIY